MKKLITYIVAGIVLLAWNSCSRELETDLGTGWLILTGMDVEVSQDSIVTLDNSVLSKTVATKAEGDDIVMSVLITNSAGETVQYYEDHRTIPSEIALTPGNYTVTALSGDTEAEAAFDNHTYKGETQVKITSGASEEISLHCYTSNIVVEVGYTDKFKAAFPEYNVLVGNSAGSLVFEKDETRKGYIKEDGTFSYTLSVKNQQGATYSSQKSLDGIKAGDHVTLMFDAADKTPAGDDNMLIALTVDETVNEIDQSYEIKLTKGVPPTLTSNDFDSYNRIQVISGSSKTAVITAASDIGIQNIYLRHTSHEIAEIGVPMSCDLINLTAEQITALSASGITVTGNTEGTNSVSVDFTGMTPSLPTMQNGAMEHQIELILIDAEKQYIRNTYTFNVIGSPLVFDKAEVVTDNTNNVVYTWDNGIGAVSTNIYGGWTTETKPDNLSIQYKLSDESNWTSIPESELNVNLETKTVSATISGLKLKKTYIFKLVSSSDESGESRFTTPYPVIPNMNCDTWSTSDNKCWYMNPTPEDDTDSSKSYWASGNEGSTKVTKSTTTPESDIVVKGKAARLETLSAGAGGSLVGKPIAAGSLFTGDFAMDGLTQVMNFGRPFAARPTQFTGYYYYLPKQYDGKTDMCHIYIKLSDGAGDIGYGEFKTDRTDMTGYEKFSIDINYTDTRVPTTITIVITSSIDGESFKGGVGSILYVDELDFEY